MFKVVTEGREHEVWASGFADREKPERMLAEGYWHRHMYPEDKHKVLVVVEDKPIGRKS
jgi:hypothetical protein